MLPALPVPVLPENVRAFVDHQAELSPYDFADLKAVFFNGTLKRSPEPSHTGGLAAIATELMRTLGGHVDGYALTDRSASPIHWIGRRAWGLWSEGLTRG